MMKNKSINIYMVNKEGQKLLYQIRTENNYIFKQVIIDLEYRYKNLDYEIIESDFIKIQKPCQVLIKNIYLIDAAYYIEVKESIFEIIENSKKTESFKILQMIKGRNFTYRSYNEVNFLNFYSMLTKFDKGIVRKKIKERIDFLTPSKDSKNQKMYLEFSNTLKTIYNSQINILNQIIHNNTKHIFYTEPMLDYMYEIARHQMLAFFNQTVKEDFNKSLKMKMKKLIDDFITKYEVKYLFAVADVMTERISTLQEEE